MAILKRIFAATLVLSVLGGLALLEPHLEFAIFDALNALHLPAPLLGTVGFYAECVLIAAALGTGLTLLVLRFARRKLQ